MLDTTDFDKDALRNRMREWFTLKYADMDAEPYRSRRLRAAFAAAQPLTEFDPDLFAKVVSRMYLDKGGAVSIVLINGQRIVRE